MSKWPHISDLLFSLWRVSDYFLKAICPFFHSWTASFNICFHFLLLCQVSYSILVCLTQLTLLVSPEVQNACFFFSFYLPGAELLIVRFCYMQCSTWMTIIVPTSMTAYLYFYSNGNVSLAALQPVYYPPCLLNLLLDLVSLNFDCMITTVVLIGFCFTLL